MRSKLWPAFIRIKYDNFREARQVQIRLNVVILGVLPIFRQNFPLTLQNHHQLTSCNMWMYA